MLSLKGRLRSRRTATNGASETRSQPANQRRADAARTAESTGFAGASSRRTVVSLFCAALACRLVYAFLRPPIDWPDSRTYLANGRALLQSGHVIADNVMPLYPAFAAMLGRFLIPAQVLLSSGLVFVAYALARRIFHSPVAARYAAVLIAFDPVMIFYSDQALTETLYTFLLCTALLLFYEHAFGWASVVFVLSVLVRPTLDPLGPVLVVLCSLSAGERVSLRKVAGRLALYAAVYVALMAPWWWHNYRKYGQFVRLDLGDGVVLRVEHNPAFAQAGFDWDRLRPYMTEYDSVPNPILRNKLYRRAAIEYIVEQPGRYLMLVLRRFGRFWSPLINQSEHFSPRVLGWASLFWELLIYLGIIVTAVRARASEWRGIVPLLAVVASLAAVHIAIHALVRYRAPVLPLLAVLSAGFLARGDGAPLWRRFWRNTKQSEAFGTSYGRL